MQNTLVLVPQKIGHKIQRLVQESGGLCLFLVESVKVLFSKPSRMKEILYQLEFIGNQSFGIILLVSSFTGMALAYQIYMGFSLVNASSLVGPTVALGIFKELAPVLTGLVVSSRAGGSMAAQLGTMKVSEQIDALEVMSVNPKQYLVMPRLVASFLALPVLCAIFDVVAIFAAQILSTNVLGLDAAIFWDRIQDWVQKKDVIEGLIKASIFGLTFCLICCKRGLDTTGGAKGVGEATNKGVVYSMVAIIILNFFISNLYRLFVQLFNF